jgi:hypothetical protein
MIRILKFKGASWLPLQISRPNARKSFALAVLYTYRPHTPLCL